MKTKKKEENFDKNLIRKDFELLAKNGNLGYYTQCEITTIYLFNKTKKQTNFFTIITFEESNSLMYGVEFLTKKPIQIREDCKLGIYRHYKSLKQNEILFEQLLNLNMWEHDNQALKVSKFTALPKQYIPPGSTDKNPINSILKNNFHSGSYILEFFDEGKDIKTMFCLSNEDLEKISTEIKKLLPLDLLFIDDRIGNIIFQFPIHIIDVDNHLNDNFNQLKLKIAWHPKFKGKKTLNLFGLAEIDGNFMAVISRLIDSENSILDLPNSDGEVKLYLTNPLNNLLLFSASSLFIKKIDLSFNIVGAHSEPRIFNGNSVQLYGNNNRELEDIDYKTRIMDRIYDKEKDSLSKTLEIKQYGLPDDNEDEAINDIIKLIQKYGENGIYLWDPFLDANDILNTLYFSQFSNIQLKAISSFNKKTRRIYFNSNNSFLKNTLLELPEKIKICEFNKNCKLLEDKEMENIFRKLYKLCLVPTKKYLDKKLLIKHNENIAEFKFKLWKREQVKAFEASGNNLSLNLEFRCQYGDIGYAFHDRFLIFPNKEKKPRVWSLGTSINSLGKDHHIIQKVANPMIIQKAFEGLWEKLHYPINLIWKSTK